MTERKYIKPSEYAKILGINYRTAIKHYKAGLIDGFENHYGSIFLKNPNWKEFKNSDENKAILYARVSSSTNKASLDGQIERMRAYASAKGYSIVGEYKEIASGLNDERKMLHSIFKRTDYNILLAEHKDRLTRFGFDYIYALLERLGVSVEIINKTENKDVEIIDDFVSIITSFCGKIYGRKRKEQTQRIIEELNLKNDTISHTE